jgi:hypothetical protein
MKKVVKTKKVLRMKKVLKPKKKLRMKCFIVLIRRSRKSKWKQTKEVITHFNKDVARLIAASKFRNNWVKIK